MSENGRHRLALQMWEQFQTRNTATVVSETAALSLVMFLSLVGNIMVCFAVYRNPTLRRPSNYYIISLALSDILQALCMMPLSIGLAATSEWPFGTSACYFVAILGFCLAQISVYNMALMALNRYYKIVKPFRYQTTFKKKFIIVTASLAWIVAIFISLLMSFAFGFNANPHPGFLICIIEFPDFVFPVVGIVAFLPYPIILFCYWKIYRFVKMHNANVSWQSSNVEDVNITKTLFVTVVAFAGLLLPAHVVYGTSILLGFYYFPHQLMFLVTLLVFVSSCVNPFIYGYMNRSFKNEFKKCLRPRRTNP
ncbi:histamine H2 receptor-like [Oculina patagonica]